MPQEQEYYFRSTEGETFGPFTHSQMRQQIADSIVSRATMVRTTSGGWSPAFTHQELYSEHLTHSGHDDLESYLAIIDSEIKSHATEPYDATWRKPLKPDLALGEPPQTKTLQLYSHIISILGGMVVFIALICFCVALSYLFSPMSSLPCFFATLNLTITGVVLLALGKGIRCFIRLVIDNAKSEHYDKQLLLQAHFANVYQVKKDNPG